MKRDASNGAARPRVFVSSVMNDFQEYRAAARTGVERAGCDPVMAEDWPSLGTSSRTACLDLVASADALVLLVGSRGGWRAPSGSLVVEEELAEALARKLPVRAFVQEGVERDSDAQDLVKKVSDYIQGLFRKSFSDPHALATAVESSLDSIRILPVMNKRAADDVRAIASNGTGLTRQRHRRDQTVTLRFVLAPQRNGELIDPRKMDDPTFQHAVMAAAQYPEHRLIRFGQPIAPRTSGTALILDEQGGSVREATSQSITIEIHEDGLVVIETPVGPTGHEGGGMPFSAEIDESQVESTLRAAFKFSGAVYQIVDPHMRFERFWMNVAVTNASNVVLVPPGQPRRSYTIMRLSSDGRPTVFTLPQTRDASRRDLAHPDEEIGRAMAYMRRTLSESEG